MDTINSADPITTVLEVLDAHDRVIERIRLEQRHFTVGRGFDNDVILTDEFVSTAHLQISVTDSQFLIRDHGSTNGFFHGKDHHAKGEALVNSEAIIKVGQTRFRLHHAHARLDKTLRDRVLQADKFWSSNHKGILLSSLLVLLGLYAFDVYLETPTALNFPRIVGEMLMGLTMVIVWAGVWALFTKLMTNRFSFFQHAGIFIIANVGLMLLTHALSYGFYALNWDAYITHVLTGMLVLVVAWLIYRHLGVSTELAHGTRCFIGSALAILGAVIFLLDEEVLDETFNPAPDYTLLLKPPELNLRDGTSIEAFFAASRKQFADQQTDQ